MWRTRAFRRDAPGEATGPRGRTHIALSATLVLSLLVADVAAQPEGYPPSMVFTGTSQETVYPIGSGYTRPCGAETPGLFAATPTLQVRNQAGSRAELVIEAFADPEPGVDPTLAVQYPDGSWVCDDDNAGQPNPRVTIEDPGSGPYLVFLGVWPAPRDPEEPSPTARVRVSSRTPAATLLRNFSTPDDLKGVVNVDVEAGGMRRLPCGENAGDEFAPGYFGATATLRINFDRMSADASILVLAAQSTDDLTLAVRSPGGRWQCNDDFSLIDNSLSADLSAASDLNPAVALPITRRGEFQIWVGSFERGQWTPGKVTMQIVRLARRFDNAPSLQSGFVQLESRFLRFGGDRPFPNLFGEACTAFFTGANEEITPSLRFFYDRAGRRHPLTVRLRSLEQSTPEDADALGDPVLIVRDPGGAWHCNDNVDASRRGSRDSMIRFERPLSGEYDVFAAAAPTWSEVVRSTSRGIETVMRAHGTGELQVLEYLPPDPCSAPLVETEANASAAEPVPPCERGSLALGSVALSDLPSVVELDAGGPIDASAAIDNTSGQCRGHISERPSLKIAAASGEDFTLRVHSRADTSLVVLAPDGRWLCDDDSGAAFDPQLAFRAGEAGVYVVFVGNYDAVGTTDPDIRIQRAELLITRN